MTRDEQLAIFEQPAQGDVAILACGHQTPITHNHPRTKTGWYAATWCHDCGHRSQVERIIYTREPRGE